MDKSFRLFLLMVGIVILPIVINLIAHVPFPSERDIIAGDEGDWVGFFGSYVGALVGAAVTLFVVYRAMKHNALNVMMQNQKNKIDDMKRVLAENISSFDFVYLGSEISLIPISELPKMSDYVLIKLNEKHMNANQKYNSWVVLFHDHMTEYEILYTKCLERYMSDIDDVTCNVRGLKAQSVTINEFLQWSIDFNQKMFKHKEEYLQPLADASNRVLEYENGKLRKMEIQLSRLIPNLKF